MEGGVGIRSGIECSPQFTCGQPESFLRQSLQFRQAVEFAQGKVHCLCFAGDAGRRYNSLQQCLPNIHGHFHTDDVWHGCHADVQPHDQHGCGVRFSNNSPSSAEQAQEFLNRKISLPQDASERALRQIFVMEWDGDLELGPGAVEKAGVTAGLVVNIEAGSLQSFEAISCLH